MGAMVSCADGGNCCSGSQSHRPQRVLLHQKPSEATVKDEKERWKDMFGSGGNSLHHAAVNGNQKEVDELVRAGYSVESLDSKGRTPFFMACRYGKLNTARRLVELGANTSVVDNKGNSPTDGLSSRSAMKTWYDSLKKTGKIPPTNQYFKLQPEGSFSQKQQDSSHHGNDRSAHGADADKESDGDHKKGSGIKKDMFSVMDIDVHFSEDMARRRDLKHVLQGQQLSARVRTRTCSHRVRRVIQAKVIQTSKARRADHRVLRICVAIVAYQLPPTQVAASVTVGNHCST